MDTKPENSSFIAPMRMRSQSWSNILLPAGLRVSSAPDYARVHLLCGDKNPRRWEGISESSELIGGIYSSPALIWMPKQSGLFGFYCWWS
ncbi:hypothetical protein MSAN_01362400 [Mycena sanguinolenta]|uniref:Uncharacterized protein n=1 Tax=Mycena sanguinolenta TaxID=230812 RepID=A0A8H7D3R1_9AGAR|nr:hypothetical protein MSAN_01362400 [Mycena sanguinolenta]